MGITCRTTATSLGSIGVVSPFRLSTCGRAAMGCGHSVRVFPILGSVLRAVVNRSPCGDPASVNIGVTNFTVGSGRTIGTTTGRRVIHHCCGTLITTHRNVKSATAIAGVRFLVRRMNAAIGSHPIITTTLSETRRANSPTITLRLRGNGVLANGASSLLNTSSTLVLGYLGRLTNVPGSVSLVSSTVVRPIRGLGARVVKGRGPHLRASRILRTLSVYTIADSITGGTLSRTGGLGNYRTRSSIVLSHISRSIFEGLNVGVAFRPGCRAGGLCRG